MTPGRWLIAVGAVVSILLAPDLARPGYSPDEEFTLFAVRGIRAQGLPLLPSGLLYDRGLLYSYAAALAGGGDTLQPARLVSLDKGTLKEGADADVTLIDPGREWTIDMEQFASKSRNCPFHGWKVRGRAVMTIVAGEVKWELTAR